MSDSILTIGRNKLTVVLLLSVFALPVRAEGLINPQGWIGDLQSVGLAAEVISDNQLTSIRGQGVSTPVPEVQVELGVILWDEGKGGSGNRGGSGHGNAVVTVEVRLGGR